MAVEVGGGSESHTREPVEDTAYLVGLYQEKGHVFHAFPDKRHVLSNNRDPDLGPHSPDKVIVLNTENEKEFVIDALVKKKNARLYLVIVKGECFVDGKYFESSDNVIKLRLGGILQLGGETFMFSTRKDKENPLLKKLKARRLPSLPQGASFDNQSKAASKKQNGHTPTYTGPFTRSYSCNSRLRKLPNPPGIATRGKKATGFLRRATSDGPSGAKSSNGSVPGGRLMPEAQSSADNTGSVPDGVQCTAVASVPNTSSTGVSTPVGSTLNNSTLSDSTLSGSTLNNSTLSGSTPVGCTPVGSTQDGTTPVSSVAIRSTPSSSKVDSGYRSSIPWSSSDQSISTRDSILSSSGEISPIDDQHPEVHLLRPSGRAYTWDKPRKMLSTDYYTRRHSMLPLSSLDELQSAPTRRYSLLECPPSSSSSKGEGHEKREFYRRRRHDIAKELFETEEKYVARLKLIAVDFYRVVVGLNQTKTVISDLCVKMIFLNIQSIYAFHQELLQSLSDMLAKWPMQEGLGLVLSELAPFLKLYVHYISKFDSAMRTLTEFSRKEKKFEAALKKFESAPACGNLTVAHYMLEPVQRIPRYRLLLVDYLKHLPQDSLDYKPALRALDLISEAADKANNEIKHFENLNEILAIQRSLQDYSDPLVTPGRRFLKKGKLFKSTGNASHLKMFFLFSDIMIYANILTGGNYKCRNVMPVLGMKVIAQQFTQGSLAFHVISKVRSLTLFAQNEQEKQEWVEALSAAIYASKERKKSFKRRSTIVSIDEGWFGVHSPVLLPCDGTSRCMQCDVQFSFRVRKSNCRACGKVVCSHCSKYKAFLLYKGKEDKVCQSCYEKANSQGLSDEVAPIRQPVTSTSSDFCAFQGEILSEGYLLFQHHNETRWDKFWFQLKSDRMLYKFKDHENMKTLDEIISLSEYEFGQDEDDIISLSQSQRSFRLKMLAEGEIEGWLRSITKAKFFSDSFSLSL